MTENDSKPQSPQSPLTVQRVVARGGGGFVVDVDAGDSFIVRSDLPVARGGTNAAPPPGQLMRVSVAACLAIGYRSWATQLGVAIDSVEVDLSTEIDMRGQAGAAGVVPGWQSIRWHVRVTSSANESDIARVLDRADSLSPMLETIHPRCRRVRTFEIVKP